MLLENLDHVLRFTTVPYKSQLSTHLDHTIAEMPHIYTRWTFFFAGSWKNKIKCSVHETYAIFDHFHPKQNTKHFLSEIQRSCILKIKARATLSFILLNITQMS